MKVKIRDFKITDYKNLKCLWNELDLDRPERNDDLSVIRNTLKYNGKLLVMLTEFDELIGSCWITNNGRRLYLHHMGIKKQYHGKGYSKQLMEYALNFAKKQNLQIKLEVHRSNNIAKSLYKSYGFNKLNGYEVLIKRD